MSTLPPPQQPNHYHHEAHHAHAHHLLNHHHPLGCTCQCTRHCFQHCKQLKRQKMNQFIVAQSGDTSGGAIGPLASTALIGMSQMNQPWSRSYQPNSYYHNQPANQRSIGSSVYQLYQQPHSATYQQVPMSQQRSAVYPQISGSQISSVPYQQVPVSQQCSATYQQVPVSQKSLSIFQQTPFLYRSFTNQSTNLQGSSNAYQSQSVIHWAGRPNEASRYPQLNSSVNSSLNRSVDPFSNPFTNPSVVSNTSVNVSVNPLQEVLRSIRASVIMNAKSNVLDKGSSRPIVASLYPLIIKSVDNESNKDSIESAKVNDQLDFDYRNSFEDVSDADEDDQKDGKLVIDDQNREDVQEDVPADYPKDSQASELKDSQKVDPKDAQVDVPFIDSQESSIVLITKPPETNYLTFEMKDSTIVILDSGTQANHAPGSKVAQNDPMKLKLLRQADDTSVSTLAHDPSLNPLIKPSRMNPSPDSTTNQPNCQYNLENRREYRRRRILATETPKQREARLAKQRVSMRKFYRNRRAKESKEQKFERFEYARKYREQLKVRMRSKVAMNNKELSGQV